MTVPTDPNGAIGATNYPTFPFVSNVTQLGFYASPYLTPGQLFFQSNPQSTFNNAQDVANAQGSAQALENQGIVPFMTAQRWEDTYIASLPAGTVCTNEGHYPWIAGDRAAGTVTASTMDTDAAYSAWAHWIQARLSSYGALMKDGGTYPMDAQSRADNYHIGHISFGTPIDSADIPGDLIVHHSGPITYGDLFAYQYGKVATKNGCYGWAPSDLVDSNVFTSDVGDFNQRHINRFAQIYGYTIPSGTIASQATWILQHAPSNWVDYICNWYSMFFNEISQQITLNISKPGLVIDQCGMYAAYRRMSGVDARRIVRYLDSKKYLAIWDSKLVQTDRGGPLVHHPMGGLSGPVVAAAREPYARNMSNIEAIDDNLTNALNQFYPTLSASDKTELGQKIVKQIWLYHGWAHICGYYRDVRRALCGASRDYWDAGSLAADDPLTSVIQDPNLCPVRPWGPALYYSVGIERQNETNAVSGLAGYAPAYLDQDTLAGILNSGQAPIGYYVSDAALSLGNLRHGDLAAPSAFLVPVHSELMTSSELTALQAIAPVVTSTAALAALPNQPISMSNGLCGFAFISKDGRLVVVLRSPSLQPDAGELTGTLTLRGLVDGTYPVTHLFVPQNETVTVSGGVMTYTTTMGRWGCKVFTLPASIHT